jgi:hypothetical protein
MLYKLSIVFLFTFAFTIWGCEEKSTDPDPSPLPPSPVHIKSLVDIEQEVGYYRVFWYQDDSTGSIVEEGQYFTIINAGNFSDSLEFGIYEWARHVAVPPDTLEGDPPMYIINLNSNTYDLGDTVVIDYGLPCGCHVRIDIEQF